MTRVEKEVNRFSKIWEEAKVMNPNGYTAILTLFLSTVNPKILTKVEEQIQIKYAIENT